MQAVKNLAILGAVAFAVPVQANDVQTLKPVTTSPVEIFLPETGEAGNRSDGCAGLNSWGVLTTAGGSLVGDTTGMGNDFVNDYPDCAGYGSDGIDEIKEFTVDTDGLWEFSTCGTTGWDTSLGIREETGGGCPGDPYVCQDGDCAVIGESFIRTVPLFTGTTYYLVVDAFRSGISGPYQVDYSFIGPTCETFPEPDAYCNDGVWCNGEETCNVLTHLCEAGTPPCVRAQTCDEDTDECIDPDPNLVYQNTGTFAWSSLGGGTDGTLVGDDWGFAAGNLGRNLQEYNVTTFGAAANYGVATTLWGHGLNCIGGSFEGDQCDTDADCPGFICAGGVNDGLPCATTNPDCPGKCSADNAPCFTDGDCAGHGGLCFLADCATTDGTCVDEGFSPVVGKRRPGHAEIPGTLCVFFDLPAGYFVSLNCVPPPGVVMPADGVWQVMGFFNTGGVAGPALAGQRPEIGTSIDVFAWDLGSNGASWTRFFFACGNCSNWSGDLRNEPVGACCTQAGGLGSTCTIVTEADCTAGGGTLVGFNNAVHQFDCDADADGDGMVDPCDACTDSDGDGFGDPGFPTNTCPDDACPDNAEFAADTGPCNCSSDDDDGDDPGDNSCLDCVDACPNEATFCADTGPCNCSTSDVDGDGTLDCVDACPNNPDFAADRGPCQCNSSDIDNDGCLDCVDACPDDPAKCSDDGTCGCGVDDNADIDSDGVPDCIDQCNGVDDAVFAPECVGAIPTVSEWGLVILALLLLVAGKVYFGRRSATA